MMEVKNFSGFNCLVRVAGLQLEGGMCHGKYYQANLKNCIASYGTKEGRNCVDTFCSVSSQISVFLSTRPTKNHCLLLNLVDEQYLLRCKGCINNSSLPQESKNPVFLPSTNDFVQLLIEHIHACQELAFRSQGHTNQPEGKVLDSERQTGCERSSLNLCDL